MANQTRPVTARIPDGDVVRIEWAAQMRGESRSSYIARAAAERARKDLRNRRKKEVGNDG